VIQASKPELRIMRYELTDYEWPAIKPMLPNKPRDVPRVNDRRIPNGIFWVLRSGAPWRDLPQEFGPIPPATIASFAGVGLGVGPAA
jgi:transposase